MEIMEKTGVHKKTISKWRNRWVNNKEKLAIIDDQENGIVYQRMIVNILSDEPRCGTPSKFTAEQICLIINVSCESPRENDFPFSHWSLASLASVKSTNELKDKVLSFINYFNQIMAKPFKWTYRGRALQA